MLIDAFDIQLENQYIGCLYNQSFTVTNQMLILNDIVFEIIYSSSFSSNKMIFDVNQMISSTNEIYNR